MSDVAANCYSFEVRVDGVCEMRDECAERGACKCVRQAGMKHTPACVTATLCSFPHATSDLRVCEGGGGAPKKKQSP